MYTLIILKVLAKIISSWDDRPMSNQQWRIFRLYLSAFNQYLEH